ncbi:MAG: hypothetical protein AAF191_08860 [Verrucomicrobiota bacterium]
MMFRLLPICVVLLPNLGIAQNGDYGKRTAIQFAKEIEPRLGAPPRIVLDECIEIPVYVNGVQQFGVIASREADNPNFQAKTTTPSGSVVQRYPGKSA